MPARTKNIARTSPQNPRGGTKSDRSAIFGSVGFPGFPGAVRNRTESPVARKKKVTIRFGGVPQNPKYLAFIRCFDCILKGLSVSNAVELSVSVQVTHVCAGKIEAAHTGRHGRGQKAADETTLPMFSKAHRKSVLSHHNLGKKFWEFWGLDRAKLVSNFNEMAVESEVLVQEYEA